MSAKRLPKKTAAWTKPAASRPGKSRRSRVTYARVRMYRVGFGDCFLLSLTYNDGTRRHVLFDFGRTHAPEGAPSMEEVAEDIAETCGSDDVVVVVTHRHQDHLGGFTKRAFATLRALKVRAVVQPWTEDPSIEPDAEGVFEPDGNGDDDRIHRGALLRMHTVAADLRERARHLGDAVPKRVLDEIEFLGMDNIGNREAVENLAKWPGAKKLYLRAGEGKKLAKFLPGIGTHVLGPPTQSEWAKLGQKRARDAEYWHLLAFASAPPSGSGQVQAGPPFASRTDSVPAHFHWFRRRVRSVHAQNMLSIVRALDKAMNNTSLILFLEMGSQRLLFPGDAQIENWSYALSQPGINALLEGTTFYKVGHHGSLNATPRSMWRAFGRKGKPRAPGTLISALSTLEGVHGDVSRKSEVPRRPLVAELESHSTLHRSDRGRSKLFVDIQLPID